MAMPGKDCIGFIAMRGSWSELGPGATTFITGLETPPLYVVVYHAQGTEATVMNACFLVLALKPIAIIPKALARRCSCAASG